MSVPASIESMDSTMNVSVLFLHYNVMFMRFHAALPMKATLGFAFCLSVCLNRKLLI